jgi:hypothetical protein
MQICVLFARFIYSIFRQKKVLYEDQVYPYVCDLSIPHINSERRPPLNSIGPQSHVGQGRCQLFYLQALFR